MTGKKNNTACLRQLTDGDLSEQRQLRHPLSETESIAIGRDPRCQIVLDPLLYRAVSRRHAEITPILGFDASTGSRFWQICDLNSANGTFVNGQRLKGCQVLQVGDRIMLGQDGPEFVFEFQPHPGPKPPLTSQPSTSSKPTSPRSAPAKKLPPTQSPTDPTPTPPGSPSSQRPTSPNRQKNINLPSIPAEYTFRPITPPPGKPSRLESDHVSLTQLFPIFSTGRHLTNKAYLLPGGITVALVVSLFLSVGNPIRFNRLLAAYLAGAAYYFIYQLCGKRKPWWLLVGTALATVLILFSPILDLLVYIFREILPGSLPSNSAGVSLPVLLVKMFFGAGLMEELLKAIPVLAVYLLGTRLRSPWREQLGVWEPLDGILLGSASAVGFTLMETLGQYIPEIYKANLVAGEGAAQLASLQLLIPRVLGSVAGHMAYSGYLGYFIGLSVLRSRRRWQILGVGYLTASGLHALWNVTGAISPVLLAVVGVLSYAFLAAAILKARELSPTRSQNFATRFYR
ncbi:PrsW family intramembrane metalloprotease [Kovacikia minuta CCNUW1]|uniref:PrsW family glutamic-type intramembrane protease n=1 Tax=Kovacikia minuta TaxID=2931930 RepID=UPI001CCBE2BD|nr:PrsW family glutamic-type intramembrane protease [Kovacikia minuta]UBF26781.1 PrsW family intramembrane metalloprotease [Kovacikia minuta CCNUW1]